MSFGTHMSPLSINKQHSNGSPLLNDVRTLPSEIQQRKIMGVGKMRNCGMRNAESKMRNGPCGKVPRNGV